MERAQPYSKNMLTTIQELMNFMQICRFIIRFATELGPCITMPVESRCQLSFYVIVKKISVCYRSRVMYGSTNSFKVRVKLPRYHLDLPIVCTFPSLVRSTVFFQARSVLEQY